MAELIVHLDGHVIDTLDSGRLPFLRVKQWNLKYLSKASLKLLICGQSADGGSDNDGGTSQRESEVIHSTPGLTSASDLEPSKYEGGFKVWESTKDLLELLYDDPDLVRGKTVLDIGCGAGLIGIACLALGASHVSFQDFNIEVLQWSTLPNIVLNRATNGQKSVEQCKHVLEELKSKVTLFYGDWSETPIPSGQFDVTIASETIYNQDNYPKLSSLIDRCIKPTGKAIIGAKTHYFGVGGGTRAFEEYMATHTKLKTSAVVKVIESPVQREIIMFQT